MEWEGENERRPSWRGRSEGVKWGGGGENERRLCGRGRSRGGGFEGGRVGGVDEDL